MKTITVIGDMHGQNWDEYVQFISLNAYSIQIGDFGLEKMHQSYLRFNDIMHKQHKILFGNHDWYPNLNCEYSLGNFGTLFDNKIFYIRGANSIDKHLRYSGIDWFENEQLSYTEMQSAIDLYETVKPEIVISHTCPQIVKESQFGFYDKSFTELALNEMFGIHNPRLWIFGHFHQSKVFKLCNTTFKSLGINEYYSINF